MKTKAQKIIDKHMQHHKTWNRLFADIQQEKLKYMAQKESGE